MNAALTPPSNIILHGDCLHLLPQIPDCSIQSCITSPPYYGLRDYGVAEQIGLEDTPEEYIAKLVTVFREIYRILKDDGVLWLNLGDSYSGSGKGGQPDKCSINWQPAYSHQGTTYPGLAKKQLLGIPWRVALALQADGWYLRSDVIWQKTNCMPEPVTDRPTRSHEYVFLLSKYDRYYYDTEAIQEPIVRPEEFRRKAPSRFGGAHKHEGYGTRLHSGNPYIGERAGKNRRSVWSIPTYPLSAAHFATMPPRLAELCILASSRPNDLILDPFMGAGTVALVALQHGRRYLGIEINQEYIDLARHRIATFQPTLWTATEPEKAQLC